jgi:hypothetical protein
MGTAGFEVSGAASFDQLRAFLATPKPGDPPSASEATRLLDAVGASPVLSTAERQRAAAVKMLRHTCLVRRWFGESTTADTEIAAAGATLLQGFKTISGGLNRNQVILTDFVPLRGAAQGSDEEGYLDSEAFVFALPSRERLDVIYIERDFFRPGGTVAGKGNWSRILVHEMSHLLVGTDDVPAGADSR